MPAPIAGFSPQAGKLGRVVVGATNLFMMSYDIDVKADDLDTTTFENNGFETGTVGIFSADVSFEGIWNSLYDYYNTPSSSYAAIGGLFPSFPGLYPRDDLGTTSSPGVQLYVNRGQASPNIWTFPVMRVLSTKHTATVRDFVKFNPTLKNNGSFTPPSGTW